MRFTLRPREGNVSYWKICQGRKWVGRVWQHVETKKYHSLINTTKGQEHGFGDTPEEAFRSVASRAMGFENAEQVREHNRAVRGQRAASKARANAIMGEYYRTGDIGPLVDALLGKKPE